MYFDQSMITDAGAELLTRATAGSEIIWGRCGLFDCVASETSVTLKNCVASGAASSKYMDTDKVVQITCQMDNTGAECKEGNARSFGAWAKIKGDAEETLVIVAVTTGTPTVFPTYTGTETTRLRAIMDYSIRINEGALVSINVEMTGYALVEDLVREAATREAFDNRCVTTHAAGNTNAGDDQIIKGQKRFSNDVTIDGQLNIKDKFRVDPSEMEILNEYPIRMTSNLGTLMIDPTGGSVFSDGCALTVSGLQYYKEDALLANIICTSKDDPGRAGVIKIYSTEKITLDAPKIIIENNYVTFRQDTAIDGNLNILGIAEFRSEVTIKDAEYGDGYKLSLDKDKNSLFLRMDQDGEPDNIEIRPTGIKKNGSPLLSIEDICGSGIGEISMIAIPVDVNEYERINRGEIITQGYFAIWNGQEYAIGANPISGKWKALSVSIVHGPGKLMVVLAIRIEI